VETKNCVFASLAGGVVLFATGFLLYGVLFRGFFEANAPAGLMKTPPDMGPLIAGELVFGAFLALILSKWSGTGSFAQGARAGALLGLLLGLGINLVFYATMNMMEAVVIPADTVITVVRFALAGGAVGAVLGRG
jgi:hypothetical protein